eukprot:941628-Amphidinium_carterae.1
MSNPVGQPPTTYKVTNRLTYSLTQDFAMKVYHFWRLVGPQLRERPEEQPRDKLPAEPPVPPPTGAS